MEFIRRSAATACLALLIAMPLAAQERAPNIVVVLADDLGYGDIGAYGNDVIRTPHLDRMAQEGSRLTGFYSSANICTPSRGGLLTGRYPARLGLALNTVAFPTNDVGLPGGEITIATALKARGFTTACIGKWHLGQKSDQWVTAHGFDYFFGVPYSNDMTPFPLFRGDTIIEESADQSTLTQRYTSEAIQFIESHRDKPFFLYLAHTMPHVPLYVSEQFEGKSKAGVYGDVVETIDWGMGELFATLKRLDLDENTLVIFTSDNGPWWEGATGAYRDRKGSAWEGGMRVPLIARWPGRIPAGVSSGAIAMNFDLFPTILSLAGAELPADREIDGRNIWDVLCGSDESPHEFLYLFDGSTISAVRSQRWKLVAQSWYRGYNAKFERGYNHTALLFDLENDPAERYSLRREHPDVVNQMYTWLVAGRAALERDTE